MPALAPHPEMTSPPYADDAARWAAVLCRDQQADGCFYYAVKTTGIYCRPSCAARRARREHVSFYPTGTAAEQAGFRPCQRCRPHEPGLAAQHAALVAQACRQIETAVETPDLAALAASAGMSRFHFQRVFKAVTGVTPKAYATAHRTQRVRQTLRQADTVTAAIYEAGFQSNGRFYATAAEVLGMTPRVFRAGGPGVAIRFAVGPCSLGTILIAATDRGLCAILLGDDPETLIRDLQGRFPQAALHSAEDALAHWMAQVIGCIETPALGLALPLDVQGTAFQQRVWQALRAIPAGTTASYTDIASRIGRPTAARAVAQACAANPLAVAIPCHRVVRQDGALSGYRWGVERKRWLLEREATG